jgi:hypothetical protein
MVLAAQPAFVPAGARFGTQTISALTNEYGSNCGNGASASGSYSSAPQDFWRMLGDINHQQEESK